MSFQTREYDVQRQGVVLRLKRSRIAARLYVSDAHVVDVLRRWLNRSLLREHPEAVPGREVIILMDDMLDAPRIYAILRRHR